MGSVSGTCEGITQAQPLGGSGRDSEHFLVSSWGIHAILLLSQVPGDILHLSPPDSFASGASALSSFR